MSVPVVGRIAEVGLNANTRAPVEFADAVELHFRKSGRHARLVMIPSIRTWQIRVAPRPDDPRLGAWRDGRLTEYPEELIELCEYEPRAAQLPSGQWIPGYVPYSLDELGVTGLVNWLEQADLWSGRGEVNSMAEGVALQRRRQQEAQEKAKRQIRDAAVDRAKDRRRSVLKIPFLPVSINLRRPAQTPAGGN